MREAAARQAAAVAHALAALAREMLAGGGGGDAFGCVRLLLTELAAALYAGPEPQVQQAAAAGESGEVQRERSGGARSESERCSRCSARAAAGSARATAAWAERGRRRVAFLSLQLLCQQIRRASRSSVMEHRRRSITIRSPPLTQRSAARRAGRRRRRACQRVRQQWAQCGQGGQPQLRRPRSRRRS